jgi:CRP-like cAMP-binding protein
MNLPESPLSSLGQSTFRGVDQVIAQHPFLRGMQPEHLRILGGNAMRLEFAPGELIFREGDPANRFYLLESGKVALEARQKEQLPELIQELGQGDVLGWSWLFPPYYWHFDARALQPTTAIFFYGTRLREQCEANNELGYELMKRMTAVVIQRLQATRKLLLAAKR